MEADEPDVDDDPDDAALSVPDIEEPEPLFMNEVESPLVLLGLEPAEPSEELESEPMEEEEAGNSAPSRVKVEVSSHFEQPLHQAASLEFTRITSPFSVIFGNMRRQLL